MAKSANQKIKILYIMKALLEETDENHTLSTSDILEMLASYGIKAERKSIYSDIETLQVFGMDIVNQKSQPSGYYLASREFELPELKLLVDVVQSSKFITTKKSTELIKKLEGLASHYQAQQLQRQVVVGNRIKTMNETIYYNVDKIHNAINTNVQIRFQYYNWNLNKEMELRKEGELYHVSPWALAWDDENYYMIGYDSGAEDIRHYRVDKMLKIEITKNRRDGEKFFKTFDSAAFAKKTFGMFHGNEEVVTLRCENSMAGIMIDRFGKEVTLRKDGEDHFTIRVKVAVSHQFYGWVVSLGTGIQIVSPEQVVHDYKSYLEEIMKEL